MYDEFLEKLAAGDEDTWTEAYLPLLRDILSVLKDRVRAGFGVDWEAVAGDIIVKEIMPGLRERRESFSKLENFDELRFLAKKMAAFRSIDLIRKVARRAEDGLSNGKGQEIPGSEGSVPGGEAAERMERFEELIGLLKPPKPDLFRDYFHLGLTYQEISDRRGIALGTVCSHFSRGLKQLKEILNEQGEQPVVKTGKEGNRTS